MDYKIIFSSRKTLSVEVAIGGAITVRAPKGVSKKKIDAFIKEHEASLQSAQKKQIARAENQYHRELSYEEIQKLKAAAKEYIPERVKSFAKIMNLEPSAVKISSAQKNFGSCSGKNSLNFSYRLMMYPKEAIDYVVVHELAHIKHHNHSADFYKLIEQYMPDYKKRIAILKQ
ncbi:MAG: M48 family metallopeptidase [Clostridia bacterium]|nr:M48 family metallopeptidase [Clostridia bacterium]